MKILLSGATGKVGKYVKRGSLAKGWSVDTIGRQDDCTHRCDFADVEALTRITSRIKEPYDCIVHAAALTNVDRCEEGAELALKINAYASTALGELGERLSSCFIYVSTDYVYAGTEGPYSEEVVPENSVNIYGITKLLGEIFLKNVLSEKLTIVRTSVLYDRPGRSINFVQWLYDQGVKGEPLKIVTDQYVTPTYIPDLADWIVGVVGTNTFGVRHVVGPEFLSRYEMAEKCFDIWGFDRKLLLGCSCDELSWKAQRPQRGGLVTKYDIDMCSLGDALGTASMDVS